jgi:hypothetical protein
MTLGCKQALAKTAVILIFGMTAVAQTVSIQFEGGLFRVTGWKPPASMPAGGWNSILTIYAGTGDIPPLLGTYSVERDGLVFRPSFPIAAGVRYRAVFHAPGLSPLEKTFDGPPRDSKPDARVSQVYPTADVLPSNQLRLYIYFSAPMSRGVAAQYLHILDENGKDLKGNQAVFLPGQELWDPGLQRLTMTFDPGRIKRGLTSNERIGTPIGEGKQYTLVIDRDWPDARGAPMVAGFRKTFRGGPAQRTPPDPNQWRVTEPRVGTSEALVIDFPTPMNYPLLQRMILVATAARAPIVGDVAVAREERQWRFTPKTPWSPGDYRILVNTGIEDLAGNHVGQLFDIDTFDQVRERIVTDTVSLRFLVR